MCRIVRREIERVSRGRGVPELRDHADRKVGNLLRTRGRRIDLPDRAAVRSLHGEEKPVPPASVAEERSCEAPPIAGVRPPYRLSPEEKCFTIQDCSVARLLFQSSNSFAES